MLPLRTQAGQNQSLVPDTDVKPQAIPAEETSMGGRGLNDDSGGHCSEQTTAGASSTFTIGMEGVSNPFGVVVALGCYGTAVRGTTPIDARKLAFRLIFACLFCS